MGRGAAEIFNIEGRASIVLICEHASNFIPESYNELGLSADAKISHAAYDIGAENLSKRLSLKLDAPLVLGTISRLVYDCNRPLETLDAMPSKSELVEVPGNCNLSEDERQKRFETVYLEFHNVVADVIEHQIDRVCQNLSIVTIHSFTSIYFGEFRDIEIGFIHDANPKTARLAQLKAEQIGGYKTALNEPYSQADGVTHSLRKHGDEKGFNAVMIEVRNDLLMNDEGTRRVAGFLDKIISSISSNDEIQKSVAL